MSRAHLLREALAAHARGWSLTPLRGKRPILTQWQTAHRGTADEIRQWAERGNLGIRTGSRSGIIVIDADAGSDVSALNLPETPTAITGGGGRHFFYAINGGPPIGNSAGKLGPKIDVKAERGQVVLAGSTHPDTGAIYRWAPGLSPDDIPLAPLPEHIAALLAPKPLPTRKPGPAPKVSNRYARAALDAEIEAVRKAPDRTGNDQLNRAAFSLGQLIGGGLLSEADVEAALLDVAIPRRPEAEARATIGSGIEAGRREPRTAPVRSRRAPPASRETQGENRPEILIPGPHEDDDGVYVEVGNHEFVARVLRSLPAGTLYRRGEIIGEIADKDGANVFLQMSEARLRSVIDQHVRLVTWLRPRGKNAVPEKLYTNTTRDQAGLVLAGAVTDPSIRELRAIITAPTLRPDGSILASTGYDAETGLLFDPQGIIFPHIKDRPTLEDARAAMLDIVEPFLEFPYTDQDVDLSVAAAAVLTLIGRAAIPGPCPMFPVRSTTPGSGKGLLVDAICIIATGREPARMTAPRGRESDNEMRKRILALALEGDVAILIDNVDAALGSATLAAMLTAAAFKDRVLCENRTEEATLLAVWFATGNGLTFKGDLGRRVVPVDLDPGVEHPEDREGPASGKPWTHPDLLAYVRQRRPVLVSHALTLLRAFHVAERPGHGKPLKGSFEAWDRLVRAAVIWAGGADPLDACQTVREEGDSDLDALRSALACWWGELGDRLFTAAEAVSEARARPELLTALGALAGCEPPKLDGRSLGYTIRRVQGRIAGGLRFTRGGADRRAKIIRWRVEGEPTP